MKEMCKRSDLANNGKKAVLAERLMCVWVLWCVCRCYGVCVCGSYGVCVGAMVCVCGYSVCYMFSGSISTSKGPSRCIVCFVWGMNRPGGYHTHSQHPAPPPPISLPSHGARRLLFVLVEHVPREEARR